jgi:hypothetical protein
MKPAELIRTAKQTVSEMTGFRAENVTGLERDDDGTWVITVEVLELERVPSTQDVIGTYEIGLDSDGELQGMRRRRRYPRGSTQDGRS